MHRARRAGLGVLGGLLVARVFTACGEDAPAGPATFTSSVAGDTQLASLSDAETAALCSEARAFFEQRGNRADLCRWQGFTQALFASFVPETSDAELRRLCAGEDCLNVNPAEVGGSGGLCGAPPQNCDATVADAAACLNDTLERFHFLAGQLPDCASVSRASLMALDVGSVGMSQFSDEPAGCVTYDSKCSGVSDELEAFAAEFCELIQPCCARDGLGSRCVLNVYEQAQGLVFDPVEGETCLAALRARQAPDFCESVGSADGFGSTSWYLIRECIRVMGYAGEGVDPETAAAPTHAVPPGEACSPSSGCDPGANRRGTCWFPSNRTEDVGVCVQTSATAGDACGGTDDRGPVYSMNFEDPALSIPESGSLLCDHGQGLFCDDATRVCTPTRADGAACAYDKHCAPGSFCDVGATGLCVPRRALGAACAGNTVVECAGQAYCRAGTCTNPGGMGAPCTDGDFALNWDECESGSCDNGACVSPFLSLCWYEPGSPRPPGAL